MPERRPPLQTYESYAETNSGDWGYGLVGNYNYTKFRTVYAMGAAYVMATNGTSLGSLFGLFYAYDLGVTAVTGDACGHGFGVASSGTPYHYFGDSGAWIATKLKVKNNRVDIQGPGTTSSSYGLVVTSYGGASNNFWVRDDGAIYVRSTATFDASITAVGTITASYSDERLKTFTGKIINALDKVNLLNGYYFVENEVAKSLGYDDDKQQVGVSAQEVERVMPEVVAPAPIDNKYLTVRYERLVPLLIEAIKELDARASTITALTARVAALEAK